MLIVGFLVYFESELLKRAHKNFNFVNGRQVECCLLGRTEHDMAI